MPLRCLLLLEAHECVGLRIDAARTLHSLHVGKNIGLRGVSCSFPRSVTGGTDLDNDFEVLGNGEGRYTQHKLYRISRAFSANSTHLTSATDDSFHRFHAINGLQARYIFIKYVVESLEGGVAIVGRPLAAEF